MIYRKKGINNNMRCHITFNIIGSTEDLDTGIVAVA